MYDAIAHKLVTTFTSSSMCEAMLSTGRNGLLASVPKQNAAIIEIPHPCLLVSRSLCPMLW